MAHQVTERDGLFTVREPAWHNLQDIVFPDHPTREEAQKIAHPWEPVAEPVYRRVPVVMDDGTLRHGYKQVEGFQAIVRDDELQSGTGTLGVVTDTYEPVKNSEMYDIAETIEGLDKGSVQYETGGSLMGGRKVWLLIRLRDPLVIKGDNGPTIPYFALQNSHDGSGAFRGQALMTKIVCDNTSQAADIEAKQRGTEFAFSHTKNVAERIEEAKGALAGWRESIQTYRLAMESLISMRINDEQRGIFVAEFIPMPPPHLVSERVEHNVRAARGTLNAILASETCQGIEGTAYGLVQAAIEYQQHYRAARSAETRFKRAYLDRSVVVADAIDIARRVAVSA